MGQIMDYLHACYAMPARWGLGIDDTFTMRWYHAAPGAQVYKGVHAFGSTVDRGCQDDTVLAVGEIPFFGPTWSPSGPPMYDGTRPAIVPAFLQNGVPESFMASPCTDGELGLQGDASVSFAYPASVCTCSSVLFMPHHEP